MKKRLISNILAAVMLLSLAFAMGGCGKKGECEECGQTELLTKYVSHGDTYWLCKDCYRMYKMLGM